MGSSPTKVVSQGLSGTDQSRKDDNQELTATESKNREDEELSVTASSDKEHEDENVEDINSIGAAGNCVELKEQSHRDLITALKEFESYQNGTHGDDDVLKQQLAIVYLLNSVYHQQTGESIEITTLYRVKAAEELIKYNTINIICQFVMDILQKDEQNEQLSSLLLVILNFTDASPNVCKAVVKHNTLLDLLLKWLRQFNSLHDGKLVSEDDSDVLDNSDVLHYVIGIVHNLSMVEEIVPDLRKAGCLDVIEKFLSGYDDLVRISSLSTIACIVNENECDILTTKNDLLELLMNSLKTAIQNENRRCLIEDCNMSAKELALAIKMLARNDNNKKSLVRHGALAVLVELSNGQNVEEQKEALEALWSLSFDEENRSVMVNDPNSKVIDTFQRLRSSDNKKIQQICNKALWTMRESLAVSTRYKVLGQQFLTKQSGAVSNQHVMISYNSSHRPTVINIHKRITLQGLKVWIDIDDMHGSTCDAMAKALENAAVVVICYSPQYKNSVNCRAEAEYAFKLKKKALFLKMVADYDPDGWLGLFLGSKLFYDFSGKYPFDKKITELIKAIHLECNPADTLDGLVEQAQDETKTYAPVAVSTTSAYASNILMPEIEAVKNWTAEQMEQWLDENEIPRKHFRNVTGYDVAFLCILFQQSPEMFYKTIREQLSIKDIHTMARLVCALYTLKIKV